MKNKKIKSLLVFVLPLLILISACTKFDEPALINDPGITYSASPSITSVNPSDSAVAGVREIEINGSNFAVNGKDTNWVIIGGSPARIKSITADKIVIYRPKLDDTKYGTPINISITVPTSLQVANLTNFKIESPIAQYGDFSSKTSPLTAFEVDNQENLYVGTKKTIMKYDGLDLSSSINLSADFSKFSDMKFGKDGMLYIAAEKTNLFRMDVTTWTSETYATLPAAVLKIDFDANGNIYAGTADGLYVINADKTVTPTNQYGGITIREVRVYNGAVYVGTPAGIFKSDIQDNNGTLGASSQVLDVTGKAGFGGTELNSFAIAADGTFLLCIINYPGYSVFILENDGSITPYYQDDIIPDNIEQIMWGNGNKIYLHRGSQNRTVTRVLRMGMDKDGAPYLGR